MGQLLAVRYVKRNPVRARMVRKAEQYPWSSAAAHCGRRPDPLLSPLDGLVPVRTEDWSAWLAEKEDEEMLATIRLHTRTGRPAGDKRFVSGLEARLGCRLQARPIGRLIASLLSERIFLCGHADGDPSSRRGRPGLALINEQRIQEMGVIPRI